MTTPMTTCEKFLRDGYARITGILSAEEIQSVNDALDRYIGTIQPGVTEHVFFEGDRRIQNLLQIRYLERVSHFFAKYLQDERLISVARDLLGEEVVPQQMHFFTKPASSGGGTPPHQDGYYFMLLEPVPAVTMWIALEPVDLDNGCLCYVPGSHRGSIGAHATTRRVGFSQGLEASELAVGVRVPAEPGDLLVHHGKTVHWAGPNRTGRTRRAFGCVFYGRSAQLDEDARRAYRDRIASEACK